MEERNSSHSPRTPPRNSAVQTPDTIVRSHHVSDAPYRTGELSVGREAVLHDLGSIPEVQWDSFLQVLPPSRLHPEQTERVLRVLEENGRVVDGKWVDWSTEPLRSSSREPEVFLPLDKLFTEIVAGCETELATDGFAPGPYKWTTIADTAPKSARTSTCKPDAWLVLDPGTHAQTVGDSESYYWEDCCLSAQFKKGTSLGDVHDVCSGTSLIYLECLLPFPTTESKADSLGHAPHHAERSHSSLYLWNDDREHMPPHVALPPCCGHCL